MSSMADNSDWTSHLQSIKNRRKDRSERLLKKFDKLKEDVGDANTSDEPADALGVTSSKNLNSEEKSVVNISSATDLLGLEAEDVKPGADKKGLEEEKVRLSVESPTQTIDRGVREAKADIESLLSLPTAIQKEQTKQSKELAELLSTPSWQERTLREKFSSADAGNSVQEFCQYNTKEECRKQRIGAGTCKKLHFIKMINPNTDESLGDCSFLNTCFNISTCKFIHYKVDDSIDPTDTPDTDDQGPAEKRIKVSEENPILFPPQWILSDLRTLDMSVLGKFAVVMADPPWDIHMELPYGTMSDDEMRRLDIPFLQTDGYLFLWTTGRALELARECLKLWGYERGDEIIWVKTNQLQRLIRTGRTGHWLNHAKEHCLVGVKGDTSKFNRGLDCDVIVAEVRATSHKPDEIYGIIERLAPGMRKLELFGRPHNVQPNWVTLGNQLEGTVLLDPEVVERFRKVYPDGNAMPKK